MMKNTKRKCLALALGMAFLLGLFPLSALADNYPTGLRIQHLIDLLTGTRMIGIYWNPVPLAAGNRIYRNGEQLTTLPGTEHAYLDPDGGDGTGNVYRIGAIVDGTEYGSEIRISSESRDIGTPVIFRLACDRNSPYPGEFLVSAVCRPGENANYFKLYGKAGESSVFLMKEEKHTLPNPPAVTFSMIRERIPEGPMTYWYKVRALDYHNVPDTHMYILYEGPSSPVRALTFSPLELPGWRDLYDDPARYAPQDWFDDLAALFARREAMENTELFSSESLGALLGGVLGGERESEGYLRLSGMMHPLGMALLASGLVSPPADDKANEIGALLKEAVARYGNMAEKLPEGGDLEGFRAMLSQVCENMGNLMLSGLPENGAPISLFDSRMPVMGPLYTDKAGMASMLGTLVPGEPDWASDTAIDDDITWVSGTAIDDDITWALAGQSGEALAFLSVKPPTWTIEGITADKADAAIDDDITWTVKAAGDTGALTYAFMLFCNGMLIHQGEFGSANTFTYRTGRPGTYFAVSLVTDGENGQDIQSADTFVHETKPTPKPTPKPTARPTKKPTEKPTEVPTERPTEKPTEKPTEVPTEKPTEVPTVNPNLVTKPPMTIAPLFTPVIPLIPILPGPFKP